jgi:hypothetical protein
MTREETERHIATWVYYTYRDNKNLPKCIQKDLDRAKEILGVDEEVESGWLKSFLKYVRM